MMYSKIRSGGVINGKEGFRFNIFCFLKTSQNFEMEACLLKGRGNITRKILLRN